MNMIQDILPLTNAEKDAIVKLILADRYGKELALHMNGNAQVKLNFRDGRLGDRVNVPQRDKIYEVR